MEQIEDISNFNEGASPLQQEIIKQLSKYGSMSREQLCKNLERPWTTVYDNLKKLKEKGLLSKIKKKNGNRGRPNIFWKLIKYGGF